MPKACSESKSRLLACWLVSAAGFFSTALAVNASSSRASGTASLLVAMRRGSLVSFRRGCKSREG